MTLAEKCAEVVDYFGSVNKAAEKLPISAPTLNAILRLRKLDSRVQDLVRRREIIFDSAQRLNAIPEGDRQYAVAKRLIGLPNKKQREVIQYALRFPESNQLDFRNKVAKEKPREEKIRVLIVPMHEELYHSLENASGKLKKPIEKMIPEIISEWLGHRRFDK